MTGQRTPPQKKRKKKALLTIGFPYFLFPGGVRGPGGFGWLAITSNPLTQKNGS